MKQAGKLKKKSDKSNSVVYGNFINKRPEYRYEIVGKKTLSGKLFGMVDGGSWDIAGFKKVKND